MIRDLICHRSLSLLCYRAKNVGSTYYSCMYILSAQFSVTITVHRNASRVPGVDETAISEGIKVVCFGGKFSLLKPLIKLQRDWAGKSEKLLACLPRSLPVTPHFPISFARKLGNFCAFRPLSAFSLSFPIFPIVWNCRRVLSPAWSVP